MSALHATHLAARARGAILFSLLISHAMAQQDHPVVAMGRLNIDAGMAALWGADAAATAPNKQDDAVAAARAQEGRSSVLHACGHMAQSHLDRFCSPAAHGGQCNLDYWQPS